MFNKITARGKLSAWVLTAAGIPAITLAGGCSWGAVLPAAVLCALVSLCVILTCGEDLLTCKAISLIQWLWLGIYLGKIAAASADCWERGDTFPAIPAVLILLAGFSAKSGARKAANACALLLWLAVLAFMIVFGAGASSLQLSWMEPEWGAPDLELIPLLLLPCLIVFLPREREDSQIWLPLTIGAAAVIAALWIGGSLSVPIAAEAKNPVIAYSKSLSLFGVAERFEAVVSCVLTAGWFSLYSLIFNTAGALAERFRPGLGRWGVWGCAAVTFGGMLWNLPINAGLTAIISLICWALIPILTQVLVGIKKSEKRKNSS